LDGNGKRVLLVEDDPLVAMLSEEMLTDAGYQVADQAADVETASEMARSGNYDAVMLDLNLHGASARPVAEILDARSVPFVFATGYGESGWDGYEHVPVLSKPFSAQEVRTVLGQLLSTPPAPDRGPKA
jgi:DNA-binding response OmpR family regulator